MSVGARGGLGPPGLGGCGVGPPGGRGAECGPAGAAWQGGVRPAGWGVVWCGTARWRRGRARVWCTWLPAGTAILTNRRVLYFNNGRTTSIDIAEIAHIQHRHESLIGDIIEIEGNSGTFLKIEIAPFNQGETFLNMLRSQWERTRRDR